MAVRTDAEFVSVLKAEDQAREPIESLGVAADKSTEKIALLSLAVTGLNQAQELLAKAFAFAKETLQASVGTYLDIQHQQHELVTAMKLSGQFTQENVADFAAFSKEIKNTTLVTGSQVTSMMRQAQAMGVNHDMTKLLIETSVDLGEVLKVDVTSAFQDLLLTTNGVTRGLARFFPALKGMSDEGLKGGEAVRYLNERLSGFAEAAANTAHGQVIMLEKAVKGLKVSFGELAVTLLKGDDAAGASAGKQALIDALKDITKAVLSLKPIFLEIHDEAVRVFRGIAGAVKAVDWKLVASDLGLVAIAMGGVTVATKLASLSLFEFGVAFALLKARIGEAIVALALFSAEALLVTIRLAAVAATTALVAIGFATIGIATELVIKNWTKLPAVWTTIKTAVLGGLAEISLKVAEFVGWGTEVDRLQKRVDELAKAGGDASKDLEFGVAGDLLEQAQAAARGFKEALGGAGKAGHEMNDVLKDTDKDIGNAKQAAEEFKKAYEAVIKSSKAALENAKKAAADEIEGFNRKRDVSIQEIDAIEKQGRAMGLFKGQMAEALALARQMHKDAAHLEIVNALQKQGDEIVKSADDARRSAEQAGLSEVKLAELKRRAVEDDLENIMRRAEAEHAVTDQLRAQVIEAQAFADETQAITVAKAQKKAFEDAVDAATALSFEVNKIGKDQEDIIELEREQAQLEADAALARAIMADEESDALIAQIAMRKELINIRAAKQQEKVDDERVQRVVAMIGAGLLATAGAVAGIISGEFVADIADALEGVASIPDEFLAALDRIDVVIVKLVDQLPAAFEKVFAKLPEIVDKLVAAFPKIVDNLVAAFPRIAGAIADAAPKIASAILDALPDLIAMIPVIIEKLAAAIPSIVEMIAAKIPDIVTALFDAIPKIFTTIFQMIPTIVEHLAEHADEFTLAFVEGLISAMGAIVVAFVDEFIMGGGLERIVGALLRSIPRIAIALVQGIARGLANVFGKIKIPIDFPTGEIGKTFQDGAKAVAAAFAGSKSTLFNVTDLVEDAKGASGGPAAIVKEAIASISREAARAGASLWDKITSAWRGLYDALVEAWRFLWDNVLSPIVGALREVWLFVYNSIILPLIDGIRAVWLWVYENTIQPAIAAIREVWRWIYENTIQPAIAMTREIFRWVYDNVLEPAIRMTREVWRWINDNVISPMLAGLSAVWTAVIEKVVTPLVSGLREVWNFVATNVVAVLTNIVSALSTVWMFVKTQVVDPLAAALGDIWNFVKREIVDKLAGGITAAFKTVVDAVVKPLTGWKLPDMPDWIKNFQSFKIPDLPTWMRDFSSFKIPDMPKWMKDFSSFKIPDLPASISGFKWPSLAALDFAGIGTKITDGMWKRITEIWENFADVGAKITAGLWTRITELWNNFADVGINMAIGFWNKLVGFDWGGLFGGGGGGGGGGFISQITGHERGGLVEAMHMAQGGVIAGPTIDTAMAMMIPRSKDVTPIMAEQNEFVVNRQATARNLPTLRAMNSGQDVSKPVVHNWNVTVRSDVEGEAIRRVLVPEVERIMLRKSLDGRRVLARDGARD